MLYDKDIREPLAFYLEEIYGKNRILEEQDGAVTGGYGHGGTRCPLRN